MIKRVPNTKFVKEENNLLDAFDLSPIERASNPKTAHNCKVD